MQAPPPSSAADADAVPGSASILLVDDDPGAIQLMARMLSPLGQLRFATDGAMALRLMRDQPTDLVLLDAEMPGMNGFELCSMLKAEPDLADIPVIFVTSHGEPAFEVSGFEHGAADFIAKPVSEPLVLARVKTQLRVKRLTDELRRQSTTDALTELANRRRFDDVLAQEWQRVRRSGDPIALLAIDVDHFKAYNDRYGHVSGDVVLRQIGRALHRVAARPADLAARVGGEEFALLLPQTPRAGAARVAGAVLDAVGALALPHAASETARTVTVSVGLSYLDARGASSVPETGPRDPDMHGIGRADLFEAADQALYVAKHAGRAQAWELAVADCGKPSRASCVAQARELRRPVE